MLKISVRMFVFIAAVLMASSVWSQSFKEGTHYTRVGVAPAKSSVTEYFSFSCPGCYYYESYMKVLDADSNVDLKRVHVPFGGKNAEHSQYAYMIAKLLKADNLKQEIFDKIHQGSGPFSSKGEVIDFFISKGFEETKIKSVAKSFSGKSLIGQFNAQTKKSKVTSIPALIVNGHYQVKLASLKNGQELLQLVQYLQTNP